MTEKRFYMDKSGDLYDKENNIVMVDFGYSYDGVGCKRIIDLLNSLYEENIQLQEEKEKWKCNCSEIASENSILWNEILILREQGAEPSDAFENYLNNLKKQKKIKVILNDRKR